MFFGQAMIDELFKLTIDSKLLFFKRPSFTIDRSLLYVGLMYSHKERSEYMIRTNEKLLRRRNCKYLYLHIHSAKRLPCRSNGNYADPKVKWYYAYTISLVTKFTLYLTSVRGVIRTLSNIYGGPFSQRSFIKCVAVS